MTILTSHILFKRLNNFTMNKFLKLFAISVALAISLNSIAQAPLNPYEIKNLKTKVVTTAISKASYIPIVYNNTAYKVNLNQALESAVDQVADSVLGYKSFVALVTQASTSAPTATVLLNNTGVTIAWVRSSAGVYTGELSSNILLATKTWGVIQPSNTSGNFIPKIAFTRLNDSIFAIRTALVGVVTTDSLVDARLSATPFELRLYN